MVKTCDVDIYLSVRRMAEGLGIALPPSVVTEEGADWNVSAAAGSNFDSSRVDVEAYREVWAAIDRVEMDDPWAFAKMGARSSFAGAVATLTYACGTKAALKDALAALARTYRLLNESIVLEPVEEERGVRYIRREQSGEAPVTWAGAQFATGYLVAGFEKLAGEGVIPLELSFTHRPVGGEEELAQRGAELFRGELKFGAPHDSMLYSHADLGRPLLRSEPELSALLDGAVERALAKLGEGSAGTLDRVRQELAVRISAAPDILLIAEALGVHARTLQRRLTDEGTTYQEVVDEVRREVTLNHLKNPALNLSEVAFLVGFSDPSSFSRAFKRWTGQSPRAYRKQHSSP